MTNTRLKYLREQLKIHKLDGFVIPSNDKFMSEYVPEHDKRLTWLTGFTGSNGICLVLKDKSIFFTDGRYTLQARSELSQEFEIHNLADMPVCKWSKENLIPNTTIGYDPWLHTENQIKNFSYLNLVACKENLIDLIWHDKPLKQPSDIYVHDVKYAGEVTDNKVKYIIQAIKKEQADYYLLTAPDSICWLLNIRGHDIPYNPFVLCYAIVNKEGHTQLFVDNANISKELSEHLGSKVKLHLFSELESNLKTVANQRIILDPASTPFWFTQKLENIVRALDPCSLLKACKNTVEAKGAEIAHIKDGIAIIKFLYWVSENIGKFSEIDAENKLLEFRKLDKDFVYPSFASITGFKENAAIIHYHANENTNKLIDENGLFLVDSGGQYKYGTTDITRTIAIGTPTLEQKENFTRVLKGHIAISRLKFPIGTKGYQLDSLARYHLWQEGLDYDHGTGHGVGSYLSVHEGPQRIGKAASNVSLEVGMILSNEPGYYKENDYGIRIENLVIVVPSIYKNFLQFKTLTQAPIDKNLILKDMLSQDEINCLNNYHDDVYKNLAGHLEANERSWLRNMTVKI
jgi:Xaa-Pro aminopeptidase